MLVGCGDEPDTMLDISAPPPNILLDAAPDVPNANADATVGTLGNNDAIPLTVTSPTGAICPSFSFSQVPDSENLFVGKYKTATSTNICGGPTTIALFRMDWSSYTLTLLNALMTTPANITTSSGTTSAATISNAVDPYAMRIGTEVWVAFECGGPHIDGDSSCVAPLVQTTNDTNDSLDLTRLSIPIVGADSDATSGYRYSASTPKLLYLNGHIYLYWTAIQSSIATSDWLGITTRGVEMQIDGASGQMWVLNRIGRSLPSHSPSTMPGSGNIEVMKPIGSDTYSNVSTDTEGLHVLGDDLIVFSSIGGTASDGTVCTAPLDTVPGCFRLGITRASNPFSTDAFNEAVASAPPLPPNPVEYPRIATAPSGQDYLMVNVHQMKAAAAPGTGSVIAPGYVIIPIDWAQLQFGAD